MAAGLGRPVLPLLAEVTVLVFHALRHKLELPDAMDFHESEVELARGGGGLRYWAGRGGDTLPSRTRPWAVLQAGLSGSLAGVRWTEVRDLPSWAPG